MIGVESGKYSIKIRVLILNYYILFWMITFK